MSSVTEVLLQKMLNLMPAVGSPKLEGNIGSERRFVKVGAPALIIQQFDLFSVRLSDPRKPCSMMVTIIDKSEEAVLINSAIQYRLSFGTEDILHDSGWLDLGRGNSFSVQGSIVRAIARGTCGAAAGSTVIVGGFASLNTSAKILPPSAMGSSLIVLAGATSSAQVPPPFARAFMILPFDPIATPYEYTISMDNGTMWYHIVNGEKCPWIPIGNMRQFTIKNNDAITDNTYRILYDIEF